MNTMKQILIIILSFFTSSLMAQDVIVKKDGNTIISKVLEISNTEIHYQPWSNQNGPIYVINTKDIVRINFSNGDVETFGNAPTNTEQQQKSSNSEPIQQPNSNDKKEKQNNKSTYQQAYEQARQQQTHNEDPSWNSSSNNHGFEQKTYNGHTREEWLRSAKNWHTAGNVIYWISALGGAAGGFFLANSGEKFDGTTFLILFGGGIVTGGIVNWIFDDIGDRRERAADMISASHLLKQDFQLGNTHLTAGLDLLNSKQTKAFGIGLSINL